MSDTLEVKGIEEVLQALEDYPKKVVPIVARAMGRITAVTTGYLQNQPPASEANRPRSWTSGVGKDSDPNRWYERTYGPKRVRRDGRVWSKKTSERLVESWTEQIRIYPNGVAGVVEGPVIEGLIGNKSSYVDYVQGTEQTAYHKRRGWPSIADAITNTKTVIDSEFDKALKDIQNEFSA